MNWIDTLGLISAALMPFWNIPLIIKIWRLKSSEGLSLTWVVGVWICILGMLPAALVSKDAVLKVFGIVNTTFFTGVVIAALKYRQKS